MDLIAQATQPVLDTAKLAQQNEMIRHFGNHMFVGVLIAMAPALALAFLIGILRARYGR